jgi:hypothetical protein
MPRSSQTAVKRGNEMKPAMFVALNSSQQELVDRARDLAQQKFASRAANYDRDAAFPADDFADLHQAGLRPIPGECDDAMADDQGVCQG